MRLAETRRPRPFGRAWFAPLVVVTAVALLLAVAPTPAAGATRTWTGLGATNLWSDALNWSGAAVPGGADTAVFDATSAKPATLNVNVNVSGLAVNAGYTGTLTQAAGVTVTVGAVGFSQAAGAYAGGSAAMTTNGPFALAGGTFTSTSGTLTVTGNFTKGAAGTYLPNGGTVSFSTSAATIDLGGTAAFNNVILASGTKTIAAGSTLIVNGATTLTAATLNGTGTLAARGAISQASTFGGGTGLLLIDGAANQTFTGAATPTTGALPNLQIAKSGGTLTLAGTLRTGRNWTYSSGTVDPGSSTLVMTAGILSGSHDLANLEIRGSMSVPPGTTITLSGGLNLPVAATITLDGTLIVNGATTLTAATLNGTGTLAARGAISQASTFGGGTGLLLIDGAANQTFTGAATPTTGALPNLQIAKSGGTLTLAGTLRTGRNWTYSSGTVDPGSSTLVMTAGILSGNMPLANFDLRGGTITGVASAIVTVSGTLSLTSGSFNTGTLAARGAISQASTFGGGTGLLLIDGAANQTFTGAATPTTGALPNLQIAKSGGTLTLAGTLRTGRNWTYSSGTVDPGSSTLVMTAGILSGSHDLANLEIRGSMSVPPGTTITLSGGLNLPVAATITLDGTLIVNGATTLTAATLNGTGTLAARGAISQASTFGGGTGLLLIDGAANQTFTGAATPTTGALPNLQIAKSGGTLTLAGTLRTGRNWTYSSGTVDPGSSTLVMTAGILSGNMPLANFDLRGGTITGVASAIVTVSGTLSLTSGSFNTGTLAARGAISQASTFGGGTGLLLIDGAANQTFTGAATPTTGALPNLQIAKSGGTLTLAGTLRTGRNWTYSSGTVDPGSSTLVIAATSTLRASGMTFANLVVTAGTVTVGNALAVNADLTVSGGTLTTAPANAPILVGGGLTIAGTLSANSSTVEVLGDLVVNGTLNSGSSTFLLDGGTGQAISGSGAIALFNLVMNDAAGVTLGSSIAVNGTLTLANGPFTVGAHTLSIARPITGTANNLAADSTSSIVINGSAAGITLPTSVASLNNLTINNPAGLTLGAALTVDGTLGLTGGNLDSATFVTTIGPSGSVTRLSGHVIGSVRKPIVAGLSVAVTFEVGDASVYTPATVTFGQVFTGGLLTASATPGDHPSLAGSVINPALSVNRYWTLTAAGLVFSDYDIALAWVPADVDPGASSAAFVVAKLTGGIWTAPNVTQRTATSITAGGLTTFSDFAVGEPAADLSVTISVDPDPVVAGTLLTYTLTINNAGPSDAQAVSLSDVLPAQLSGATYCVGALCDPSAGIAWSSPLSLGTLLAGESLTVRIAGMVAADTPEGAILGSTASVASTTSDPDSSNDAASASATVTTRADLALTKSGPPSALAGDAAGFDYSLTVTNQGPSDNVGGFVLSDLLPVGLSFQSSGSDATCSAVGQLVTCSGGALARGATRSFTIHVSLAAGAPVGSSLHNTASVTSSGTTDADPANDTSNPVTTTVLTAADLSVTISVDPDPVVAGTLLTYTLTINNAGPSDAQAVSLSDVLPAQLSGATYCVGALCDPSAGIAWSSPLSLGTLLAGESLTVRIAGMVAADTPEGAILGSTASVASTTSDPDSSNDAASASATVTTRADLALTKSGPPSALAGDAAGFDYSLTVTNQGPSDNVGGFVLSDLLPVGLSFQSSGSDATCSAVGQLVTCSGGALARGATRSFTIHVSLAAGAPVGSSLHNTASVTSSGTTDADPANDTSNPVTTTVLTAAHRSGGGLPDTAAQQRFVPTVLAIFLALGSLLFSVMRLGRRSAR